MAKKLTCTLDLQEWSMYEHGLVQKVLEKKLHLSRHEISRLKFDGEILLNGQKVHTDAHMRVGDELTVIWKEEKKETTKVNLSAESLPVLYEEEDFIVVNKPSGIPTHPSHSHLDDSMGTMLAAYYQSKGEDFVIRPVGRLDMEVSGVVLYAKNQPAAARLNQERTDGRLKKTYFAIAQGIFETKEGLINTPVEKIEGQRQRAAGEGKQSVTSYHVIEEIQINDLKCSVLEIQLETGRTHQIRTHMASISHPLLGDALYGGDTSILKRPALHAERIQLESPFTKEEVNVSAPVPDDIQKILDLSDPTETEKQETGTLTQKIMGSVAEEIRREEKVHFTSQYEPAVVDQKRKPFKPFLLFLICLLACGALYLFWNHTIPIQETAVQNKEDSSQHLYDELNVTFSENSVIEYGYDFDPWQFITAVQGDLSVKQSIDTMHVSDQMLIVTVTRQDDKGNQASRDFQRKIQVRDTAPPVIKLKETTLKEKSDYIPIHNILAVNDPIDGALEYRRDTLAKGTFTYTVEDSEDQADVKIVTVKAEDKNGNQSSAAFKVFLTDMEKKTAEAVSTSSTVPTAVTSALPLPTQESTPSPTPSVPADTTAPVITLREDKVEVYQGDDYSPSLNVYSVSDDTDGTLAWSDNLEKGTFSLSGTYDKNNIGDYTITVSAMDKAGNRSDSTYVISVIAQPTPVPVPSSNGTSEDQASAKAAVYSFLTGNMGMNKAQASGVMANMHRESRFNAQKENALGYYGLCQWGQGRLERLKSWCQENGYDYTSIDGQLHFLAMEMPSSYPNTTRQLMACENTEQGARDAAYIFAIGYEVAGEYYANMSLDKAAEYFNE